MLRNVILHGYLGEKFGHRHKLNVANAAEALHALQINYRDFRQSITKDGIYGIFAGDNKDDGIQLGRDELSLNVGNRDIHIVPLLEGHSGWLRIIIGIVLIVVAIWVPALAPVAWQVGFAGAAMVLGGISQLMAPTPDAMGGVSSVSNASSNLGYKHQERPEERPSYLFNGPTNTTEQGGPVPICYGTFWCGSITISAGLKIS